MVTVIRNIESRDNILTVWSNRSLVNLSSQQAENRYHMIEIDIQNPIPYLFIAISPVQCKELHESDKQSQQFITRDEDT